MKVANRKQGIMMGDLEFGAVWGRRLSIRRHRWVKWEMRIKAEGTKPA